MAKRTSRKRLFALNKLGQDLTKTAGVAAEDAIGNQTTLRNGSEIITDITIDLNPAAGALHSFNLGGAGGGAAAQTSITGVSSSSGTHGNAQLIVLDKTQQGLITSCELICVETPTGGGTHVGVWYADNAGAAGAAVSTLTTQVELIENATMAIGVETAGVDIDADIDGKYLYLAHSGSADANYTAGKLILRLYGYNVFDDV
tara:strand:- start:355 stop:960 length:606 start_codon:yes stop_codon:yes gene_type:complete